MWNPDSYLLDIAQAPARLLADSAERIYGAVWRTDFTAPGFCVLDLGPGVGSHDLRSLMLDVKGHLVEMVGRRGGTRLACLSLGRFDQQVTTKLHLDGAPERSLLVLGYEPSAVRSRLSLADYARCAHDLGMEPREFLDVYNPMYRKGEELLAGYVTELPQPAEGHSRIVLINNSSLPFTEDGVDPLGVLHGAEIPEPDESRGRVVNSMMLAAGGEVVGEGRLIQFLADEDLSGRSYG